MDSSKRTSYASKQVRAGPAPLASFEDLPSDELESPEDVSDIQVSSSIFDDVSYHDQEDITTADSLTISLQSTPRNESDFDSQFTLTPGDSCDDPSTTSELKTTSLSSLSKHATSLNVKQKKGSALSLGTYPEPVESDIHQRKTSWTDIFRGGRESGARSSASLSSSLEPVSEKVTRKKSRESHKKEGSDKQRDKYKFLTIFKKKGGKSRSSRHRSSEEPVAEQESVAVPSTTNEVFSDDESTPKILNGGAPPKDIANESPDVPLKSCVNGSSKENTSPKLLETNHSKIVHDAPQEVKLVAIDEALNDLGKIDSDPKSKIPDERKINRKLINIREGSFEKEVNNLSKQSVEKSIDKVSTAENIQANVEDEVHHNSSDSELVSEEKTPKEKKDPDEIRIEEENLIGYDMSEIDEDTVTDMPKMTFEGSKQLVILSRQQRLEVTTKPIDRPRSTTPINVAPLEAFIQTVSPTFNAKGDKIKLSLPGEQFLGRLKSPKKSAIRSWTDFCESGLHNSPRINKRTDSDEDQADPFGESEMMFTVTDSTWAAFETNFSSTGSIETAASATNQDSLGSGLDPFETYQPFAACFPVKCSCDCHAYGCASCDELSDSAESLETDHFEGTRSCQCKCHIESNAFSDSKNSLNGRLGSSSQNAFESPHEDSES